MSKSIDYAVMATRKSSKEALDDFPTPPWATRALFEHVVECPRFARRRVLEPACGRGHMARVIEEYGPYVVANDIRDYGYVGGRGKASVMDFLSEDVDDRPDFVITNPPFKLAEEFAHRALPMAKTMVALLCRTSFMESVGRYERLFKKTPPKVIAQFTERVPMVQGRLDPKASTATSYAWFVWLKEYRFQTHSDLVWIPPCRKELERDGDYDPVD